MVRARGTSGRGRPRGSRQQWWQTLLRNCCRDLPLLTFIRERLLAPGQTKAEVINDAAYRFGREPRTVLRVLKRWACRTDRVSLLIWSPTTAAAAAEAMRDAHDSDETEGKPLRTTYEFIRGELTEAELAAFARLSVPDALAIAKERARSKKSRQD